MGWRAANEGEGRKGVRQLAKEERERERERERDKRLRGLRFEST